MNHQEPLQEPLTETDVNTLNRLLSQALEKNYITDDQSSALHEVFQVKSFEDITLKSLSFHLYFSADNFLSHMKFGLINLHRFMRSHINFDIGEACYEASITASTIIQKAKEFSLFAQVVNNETKNINTTAIYTWPMDVFLMEISRNVPAEKAKAWVNSFKLRYVLPRLQGATTKLGEVTFKEFVQSHTPFNEQSLLDAKIKPDVANSISEYISKKGVKFERVERKTSSSPVKASTGIIHFLPQRKKAV